MDSITLCSIDDCSGRPCGRGWCMKHWQRWKKHGDPTKLTRHVPTICSICGDPEESKGYCSKHYQRLMKHGTTDLVGNERHGMGNLPEYSVWKGMKKRCSSPKYAGYSDYGGRGIKYCKEWGRFSQFYTDMGPRPSKYHQLDRIDNDGNYEPDNCRWVLPIVNSNNKRTNRLITINSRVMTLAEWCRELRLPYGKVNDRLNKLGWTVTKALELD